MLSEFLVRKAVKIFQRYQLAVFGWQRNQSSFKRNSFFTRKAALWRQDLGVLDIFCFPVSRSHLVTTVAKQNVKPGVKGPLAVETTNRFKGINKCFLDGV